MKRGRDEGRETARRKLKKESGKGAKSEEEITFNSQ